MHTILIANCVTFWLTQPRWIDRYCDSFFGHWVLVPVLVAVAIAATRVRRCRENTRVRRTCGGSCSSKVVFQFCFWYALLWVHPLPFTIRCALSYKLGPQLSPYYIILERRNAEIHVYSYCCWLARMYRPRAQHHPPLRMLLDHKQLLLETWTVTHTNLPK